MPVPDHLEFFIDPNRCIGCQACLQACSECDTHKGRSMIHLEYVDRSRSTQTVPVVCMHCESPTCAEVCPADAIKKTEDGAVQSARKPRCVACNNCVLACPFGVPKMISEYDLMMKCDMCYDRTSAGKKPLCATVCPSGALFFGTRQQIEQLRPRSTAINQFQFGNQTVATKVNLMVLRSPVRTSYVDVAAALAETGNGKSVSLDLMLDALHVDGEEGRAMTAQNGEVRTVAPDGRPADQQPDWRREFPIDTAEDQYQARRGFTRFLVLTSLAFVAGQFWIGVQNWIRKRRGQLPLKEIATLEPGHERLPHLPVGGALMFRYPDPHDSCLLLRPEPNKLIAYDQKCTHLSCAVVPDMEEGCLNCPCHKGVFDLPTGRPLAGPPRRPLPRIKLEVVDGIVRATDVEHRAV